VLQAGRDADVVVLDACLGGSQQTALDAFRNGDIAAVAAVVSAGVPRFVGRSRNTPAPIKNVRVAECRIPKDFGAGSH
jgi:enamidase